MSITEYCARYKDVLTSAFDKTAFKHKYVELYTLFTFHSLRHTHTTLLLEENVDIKYVSERLGYKSIEISLDIYKHISSNIKKDSDEKIKQIFGKK